MMMNKIRADSPVVLVTGASDGFGLGISVALAKRGYQVIATMRNLNNKAKLIQQADETGWDAQLDIMRLDVTDESTVEHVVEETIRKYGRIDGLINNAGIAVGGFVEEVAISRWREQFETNFFGLVTVTRHVIPWMRRQRTGKIINISSISGRIGFPGLAPYVSSKFAVEGFTESLRLELLPYGIDVSLIEPGSYQTGIWEKSLSTLETSRDPESSPYEGMAQKMIAAVRETVQQAGDPTEVVQEAIRVFELKKPELRYPIGKQVKRMIRMKMWLPWRWLEKGIGRRLLGKPKR